MFTDFFEAGFDKDITICTSAIPQGACTGDSGALVVFDEAGVSLLVVIVAFGSGEGCSVDPSSRTDMLRWHRSSIGWMVSCAVGDGRISERRRFIAVDSRPNIRGWETHRGGPHCLG